MLLLRNAIFEVRKSPCWHVTAQKCYFCGTKTPHWSSQGAALIEIHMRIINKVNRELGPSSSKQISSLAQMHEKTIPWFNPRRLCVHDFLLLALFCVQGCAHKSLRS